MNICEKLNINEIKDNLAITGNHMWKQADQHRVEREFERDWVFIRFHRYKQLPLKQQGAENKLDPRFYGLYKMIKKTN